MKKSLLLFLLCMMIYADNVHATIKINTQLPIRIFYDNSGSMYPGYRPDHLQKKSDLGVKFYYEYEAFQAWLKQFIAACHDLNAKNVSIYTFTDKTIQEIQPSVAIDDDDINNAFKNVVPFGQRTYLTDNLNRFTHNFEGIVWLITDNIIDTNPGSDSHRDIVNFFHRLKNDQKYRSVHLYQYDFTDHENNQQSSLAIYGIVVSPGSIDSKVHGFFDQKFVHLKNLFPGKKHLKLKNLTINPIDIPSQQVSMTVHGNQEGVFHEKQFVNFMFDGKIISQLTQHSISGDCRISIEGPFMPDEESSAIGISGIPSHRFKEVHFRLDKPIFPGQPYHIKTNISSISPVSIEPKGILGAIQLAFGLKVIYEGHVRFSFYNVKLKLERDRLAGIFGIDKASDVFNFQEIDSIDILPKVVPLKFALITDRFRGLLLMLVMLGISVLLGWLFYTQFNKAVFCLIIDNQKKRVPLFPFFTQKIYYKRFKLGILKRIQLKKECVFIPNQRNAGLKIKKLHEKGTYEVFLKREDRVIVLKVEGVITDEDKRLQQDRHKREPLVKPNKRLYRQRMRIKKRTNNQ